MFQMRREYLKGTKPLSRNKRLKCLFEINEVNRVVDFGVNEMQKMQKELQEKYKDKWEPIDAETGKNKLLWMIGEIGEVIDIVKKKVSIDGEEAPLTKKEFEILLLLLQSKGRVFSREDILARIWSDEVYVLDRTIDVNITRLRKKIGIYGKCIVTRLGYGYCFEAE